MFDKDTLIVSYDEKRGEPRGARSRKTNPAAAGLGDCVDCQICVQVCPTGIDIRKGLQYECIGCAACIDGCNQVMDRMGYPRGLIRYATQNSLANGYGIKEAVKRVLRPRILIYTAVLWALIAATVVLLMNRVPLRVDVIRDRATLAREVEGGTIENVYRLVLMNSAEEPQQLMVRAVGLEGLTIGGEPQPIAVPASASRAVPIKVRAPAEGQAPGSHRIQFVVEPVGQLGGSAEPSFVVQEKSVFLFPR